MTASSLTASAPDLKALVTEATRALARLDVARLEELALSCRALLQASPPKTNPEREFLAVEARAAQGDMAVFARVLEATRANLKVMQRLREIRAGRAGYSELSRGCGSVIESDAEGGDGNH